MAKYPQKCCLVVLLCMVPFSAHAYIDPGLVGALWQGLYAFVIGLMAVLVVKPWRFLKGMFSRKKKEQQDSTINKINEESE